MKGLDKFFVPFKHCRVGFPDQYAPGDSTFLEPFVPTGGQQ